MADDRTPPPAFGLHRVHFVTTEQELSRIGERFFDAFSAALDAGEDRLVVLNALIYLCGLEYALSSAVPNVDQPLRHALPTFMVGYRTGAATRGH